MKKTTIFLADDHSILREGLRLILSGNPNYEIIGEAGDGKEALELIEKLKPDITVLDISMPTLSGIEVARQLYKYVKNTKIIILSRHDSEEYIKQLLHYGVYGYVLKDDAGDDLIRAIEEVLKGNIYLSPRIATHIVSDYIYLEKSKSDVIQKSSFDILSARERVVLKLIAEGKDSNEIASSLRISSYTVKTHRSNIMKKLDLHKTADLVTYAVKNGIVEV